jgi:hypothetical protein
MENTMKTVLSRAGVALAMLAFSATAFAQGRPQTINIPLSRPGDPVHLDIDLIRAHIEVIGEDRDDAQFEVLVEGSNRKIVTPSGTVPISSGGFSFDIDEDDNEISFDMDHRSDKVSLIARIPMRANLELSAVNDSEIIVSNITGNLELSNTNGPITASRISGSVIAESVNNKINVSFAKIDAASASSFESINGELTVAIPASAGAEVHLDSARGQITSDFEVTLVPTESTVSRNEGKNGVAVRIEQVIIAKINNGGPVLRFKTLNGNINIRKAE